MTPAECRAKAAECREDAGRTKNQSARDTLLTWADSLENLAQWREAKVVERAAAIEVPTITPAGFPAKETNT